MTEFVRKSQVWAVKHRDAYDETLHLCRDNQIMSIITVILGRLLLMCLKM